MRTFVEFLLSSVITALLLFWLFTDVNDVDRAIIQAKADVAAYFFGP